MFFSTLNGWLIFFRLKIELIIIFKFFNKVLFNRIHFIRSSFICSRHMLKFTRIPQD